MLSDECQWVGSAQGGGRSRNDTVKYGMKHVNYGAKYGMVNGSKMNGVVRRGWPLQILYGRLPSEIR